MGMRLDGKTAVITGSAGQFGRGIARAYLEEGAAVLLHEWPENRDKLNRLQEELRGFGPRVQCGTHAIDTSAGAGQLAADAMAAFGKIDILVNNTSGGGHGRIFELTEAAFRRTLERGVLTYFLCSQQVGKEMARRGYGKIINISSIVAVLGSGGSIAWGADRGGIDSMTAALAQALGPYGINVVALVRGATDSTAYTPEAVAERKLRLPFGRLGREDDVIGPAIFLATDEAAWITGTVVYCDGGYTTAAVTDAPDRPKEVPYRGP